MKVVGIVKVIGKVEIKTIFWNDWDIILLLLFEPAPGAANDDISDQIILLLKHSHPGFNGLSCLVSGLQRSPSCIYLWGELACLKKIQHQHRGHLCMSIHQKWKYYRETDPAPLNLMWIIFEWVRSRRRGWPAKLERTSQTEEVSCRWRNFLSSSAS